MRDIKMPMALEGIRILELAQFLNGPTASEMLADIGADVIKIEHPVRGDAARGTVQLYGSFMGLPGGSTVAFEACNRNKKSITLDLTTPEGKEILYRLVKKSDIFLTNFFKSVTVKLGADYDTLRQHNPQIIYARTSTLGDKGPKSETRGFDYIGLAHSGMMWAMGDRDGPPVAMVGAPTDQMGSTMLAYGAVVALLARERTGIGQEISTSMLGAAVHMQIGNLAHCLFRGHALGRHSQTRTKAPFSNFYQCADGQWLMLSEIQVDRYWPQLCQALGIEELEKDPRFNSVPARRENSSDLISILIKVLATKTADEWVKILGEGVGIACSRIYSLMDLVDNPQVLANEYIIEFDHPTLGRKKFPGFPVSFSETPASMRTGAPEFGQHTEEVLLELGGYSWEDIAGFRERKII